VKTIQWKNSFTNIRLVISCFFFLQEKPRGKFSEEKIKSFIACTMLAHMRELNFWRLAKDVVVGNRKKKTFFFVF
jgi:hypothetical protein